MAEKVFLELDEEKKKRIIKVAMKEFSEFGYELSSTNRIVKAAMISKGSLFKYFRTKEELYFFLIEDIIKKLTTLETELPNDIFERVEKIAESELQLYLQYPVEYSFLKKAFFEDTSPMREKLLKKYDHISEKMFYRIFDSIEFCFSKDTEYDKIALDIVKWTIRGINEEFVKTRDFSSPKEFKEYYMKSLKKHIKVLRNLQEDRHEDNK